MRQRRPDADPMAHFARLLGDLWRQASRTGRHMIHTWHWGPGRRSDAHLLDAYLYRHTERGALRCLALTEDGRTLLGDVRHRRRQG